MGFFYSRQKSMLVAFIGSHGTGKTMTCSALHKRLGKHWSVFENVYRRHSRLLKYKSPGEVINEDPNRRITVTAMTGSALGALQDWNQNLKHHGLIDLGPPSILAYHRYWMKICDTPVSPYLLKLCRYISDQVDLYVYLPTATVSLVGDKVEDNRCSDDPIFQKDIDQWVQGNLIELNIPTHKIFIPNEETIEGRVKEIFQQITL